MSVGKHSIDMCSGPILPKMMQMVWPTVLNGILQLCFNAADMIVVGNFGSEHSFAAVGSTGSMVGLLINLVFGLSIGTGVLCSRYLGAKDDENVSKTVHTSILFGGVGGLFLTLIGECFAEQFLKWMNTPDELLGLSALYLRIYFVGMIPSLTLSFASTVLRSQGDTKRPVYYLTLAGVVNVVLNLFFVIVLKIDVAGVAIATVISQTLAAVLTLRCLFRETGACRLRMKKLRLHKDIVWQILRIGIPSGLQSMAFSLSNVVIQSSINSFGPAVMAGNAASSKLEELISIGANAFSNSGTTFIGQNFGARNYKRIDRVVLLSTSCITVLSLAVSALVLLFAKPLIGLFDPQPQTLEPALVRLQTVCWFYVICALMGFFAGAIRGLGYSTLPAIVTALGVCGFRLLWIGTVFQIPAYHTLKMLYSSYNISWCLTLFVHVICFVLIRRKVRKANLQV